MKWLLVSLLIAPLAFAQLPDQDEEGCKDSKLLTRMRGCKIASCNIKEFDSAEVMMKTADGFERKALEGQVEEINYFYSPNISQLQIVRNAETALKAAGLVIITSGTATNYERYLTMRKGSQWL